jgi:hypothetical protein
LNEILVEQQNGKERFDHAFVFAALMDEIVNEFEAGLENFFVLFGKLFLGFDVGY